MNEYLVIGCSHTRCIDTPPKDRWVERIARYTGQPFYYRKTCGVASGLIHMQRRACATFGSNPDQIKWLIIQKPQAIRFPWFIDDWENRVSSSRYDGDDTKQGMDLCVGRKRSMRLFDNKNSNEKARLADFIYQEELNCIYILRNLFSNARMAYFHYWGDYMMDSLHRPELAEVNVKLGEAVESMDIQNWKMVVDPKSIPGVYDADGDVLMDNDIMFKHGWIAYPGNLHPLSAFHDVMLEKVKNWITSQS